MFSLNSSFAKLSLSLRTAQISNLHAAFSSCNAAAPLSISNLKPMPGSNKRRKRVGRGIASSGRTCGRGNGGQKSRSGPGIPRGFEGGQTPFHLRMPKFGFHNP